MPSSPQIEAMHYPIKHNDQLVLLVLLFVQPILLSTTIDHLDPLLASLYSQVVHYIIILIPLLD